MMTFEDLKKKYSDIDYCPKDETLLMVGSFSCHADGKIILNRQGHDIGGEYLSVFTYITKKATIEQMDSFIAMIKEN